MFESPLVDPHRGLVAWLGMEPSSLALCDCDFLINRAIDLAETGSSARVIPGSGTVRYFAPASIAQRLAESYIGAARRKHADPYAVREALEATLLPAVRFVDQPLDEGLDDPRVSKVAAMDSEDVDLARLSVFLAPCHVLSHDKHLRRPGLAPETKQLDELIAAGLRVEATDGVFVGSAFVVKASSAGLSAGAKGIAVRTEVPVWVVATVGLAIVALIAVWALSSSDRRENGRKALVAAGHAVEGVLQMRTEGLTVLNGSTVAPPTTISLASRLARTLALAPHPLLAEELHGRTFAFDHDAPTVGEVRQLLGSHPVFVSVDRYRWQVGRRLSKLATATPPQDA